jgi:predicted RNA-binding Zn-ribbon protein involved in translation (DUF1610 family)
MNVGPWKTAWYCVSCKERLNEDERYWSHGRCPHCGFKSKNACTIVESYERAYRIIELDSIPWWKFWAEPRTKIEYMEEEKT